MADPADPTGAAGATITQLADLIDRRMLPAFEVLIQNMNQSGRAAGTNTRAAADSARVFRSLGSETTRVSRDVSSAYHTLRSSTNDLNRSMASGSMTFKSVMGEMKQLGGGFKAVAAVAESMSGLADTIKLAATGTLQFKDISKVFDPLLTAIPLVGGVLSKAFNFLTEATQGTYDSLKSLSSIGYTTSNSMGQLLENAADAGLNLKEFEGFVKKNAETLSKFDGGVAAGAARFSNVFRDFTTSGKSFNTRLMQLGYTTTEITDALGNYLELLVATGAQNQMNNETLRTSAMRTFEEVDLFAKASGKSRAEIIKQAEALTKSSPALQALAGRLDPAAMTQLAGTLATLGPNFSQLQKALTEGVISGTSLFSQEFAKFLVGTGGAGAALVDGFAELGQQFRDTGRINLEEMYRVIRSAGTNIDTAIAQIEVLAQAGDATALQALALLNDIKRFRALTPEQIKAMQAEALERREATELMDKFNQAVRKFMLEIQRTFLPILTEMMPYFGRVVTEVLDGLVQYLPKMIEAFKALALRVGMLFSSDYRDGVFRELTGLFKTVFAEVFEVIGMKGKARELRESARNDLVIAEALRESRKQELQETEQRRQQASRDTTKLGLDLESYFEKYGIKDQFMKNAVLAKIQTESGGRYGAVEQSYKNTENNRIREKFPQLRALPDTELTALKRDDRAFFNRAYGGRIGNNQPDDGWTFRGRGLTQLTGRNNYAAASQAIFKDNRLVENPDLLLDPAVDKEVTAWFYGKHTGGAGRAFSSQSAADSFAVAAAGGQAYSAGTKLHADMLAQMQQSRTGVPTGGGTAPPTASATPTATPAASAQSDTTMIPYSQGVITLAAQVLAGAIKPDEVPLPLRSAVDAALKNQASVPGLREEVIRQKTLLEEQRKPSIMRNILRYGGGILGGTAGLFAAGTSTVGTMGAASVVAPALVLGGTTAGYAAGEAAANYFGFANGGSPPIGRPVLVGERGPELFVTQTSGNIIPNEMLNSSLMNVNTKSLLAEQQRTNALLTALLQVNSEDLETAKRQLLALQTDTGIKL